MYLLNIRWQNPSNSIWVVSSALQLNIMKWTFCAQARKWRTSLWSRSIEILIKWSLAKSRQCYQNLTQKGPQLAQSVALFFLWILETSILVYERFKTINWYCVHVMVAHINVCIPWLQLVYVFPVWDAEIYLVILVICGQLTQPYQSIKCCFLKRACVDITFLIFIWIVYMLTQWNWN